MTLLDQVLILALIAMVGTFTSAANAQATQTEPAPQQEKAAEQAPTAGSTSKAAQSGSAPKAGSASKTETAPETGSATKAAESESETTEPETTDSETAEAPEPFDVEVAKNKIKFSVSGTWAAVPPRSRMLDAELRINRTETDSADGRLTIMGAGGSIEANISRWQSQFKQPDGGSTAEKTKTEVKTIAGQKVNLVDITGTYIDSPGGPFSGKPKVERENYRMLAAIIQTPASGNYFVKLYGPKATIDKNEEHFNSMIESLKVED